jgi:hypothetical protein
MKAQTRAWRALEVKNEAVEGCKQMNADSYHFDEEQDPDPDPH